MTETNDSQTTGFESTAKPHPCDQSQTPNRSSSQVATATTTEKRVDRPRDKAEAIRDLDYVIRLSQRHCRLYARLHDWMRFLELLGGSAAIAVAFSGSPGLLRFAGIVLAGIASANFALDPGAKARQHERTRADLTAIRADVAGLKFEEIDRLRNRVQQPAYIEGLRMPAWNDMMRTHGFSSSARLLSSWERFMATIA